MKGGYLALWFSPNLNPYVFAFVSSLPILFIAYGEHLTENFIYKLTIVNLRRNNNWGNYFKSSFPPFLPP